MPLYLRSDCYSWHVERLNRLSCCFFVDHIVVDSILLLLLLPPYSLSSRFSLFPSFRFNSHDYVSWTFYTVCYSFPLYHHHHHHLLFPAKICSCPSFPFFFPSPALRYPPLFHYTPISSNDCLSLKHWTRLWLLFQSLLYLTLSLHLILRDTNNTPPYFPPHTHTRTHILQASLYVFVILYLRAFSVAVHF